MTFTSVDTASRAHGIPAQPAASMESAERACAAAGDGRLTVLIPAHNEEDQVEAVIASVRSQTSPVDEIIVIADNCTDLTAAAARALGVTVIETRGNKHKKAGALNQVLNSMLPQASDQDHILVMDADSYLDPHFVAVASSWLAENGGKVFGGIGGTFRGRRDSQRPAGGFRRLLHWWVETVQCNEYARYGRDVNRKRGKVLVLTGTATLFNVTALRDVVAARRAGRLPCADADSPEVYDTSVLTEDNELTLALLHLGWEVRSPRGCTLTTEVMPTLRQLYLQRLRWKRGAMENLAQYGLTRVTAKYWGYQILTFIGVIVTVAYLGSIVWGLAVDNGVNLHSLWLAITAIFVAERIVTVRARGWRQMLLAAVLVPEMAFDVFLQAIHAKALADSLLGRSRHW
jgi:biofilm PGA synthesis N-glycosyltransferase PgaC